jgi:predicted ATPase
MESGKRTTGSAGVDVPSWSRCEALIKAFEEAWARGERPALGDYLQAEGEARRALLAELAHADLELRLKEGETIRVERYLAAHPELTEDRGAVVSLLVAEYDLRRRNGEGVEAVEYGLRFPDLLDELPERLGQSSPAACSVAAPAPLKSVPGYEVLGELGRGGMGVVYQARDLLLDRLVAIKLLPGEYMRDQEWLNRFIQEARTASALNHPHICTVHALGEHEERPFIVLEYVEGRTLRELAADEPGVEVVARLATQVAEALAAAHAAGVVHRDIKPDNVMVRQDGYVKVVDFGLARRVACHLPGAPETDPGTFLGTVAYASPEQARGQPAESASDIFSLGIVLYELLTGRHPFPGTSPLTILSAIEASTPVPVSELNPAVPAALQGLIQGMLQKDPRVRPTAGDVATALRGLTSPRSGRFAVRRAAGGPTTGRETERVALRVALAEAEGGGTLMVCVSGEPGIGKTTLVERVLSELAAEGRVCLAGCGKCSERLTGAGAYLPILEAIEGLVGSSSGESVVRLLRLVAPTWFAQTRPAGATGPASSQQAMLREFCAFLREVSRLAPVILFLDDVHWADLPTVDLLAHLLRHARDTRVLVIATYRPTELLLGQHPFRRAQMELQGRGAWREIALNLLSDTDVTRYLALAFPEHQFPEHFSGLIHSRSGGNPLFMVGLLDYLRDRGAITVLGGQWVLAEDAPGLWQELPESARGVIEGKLGLIDPHDRRLLAAASLQGFEFDSAVLAGALGQEPADVEERLQQLDRVHGLIRPVREQEFPDRTLTIRYHFVHSLYQQALAQELPPTRRAALSGRLAAALEAYQGGDASGAAAELAYLYESARDFGRAARHLCQAGRNAARVFAHQEAVELARHGLRLLEGLPPSPERDALELPLRVLLGLQLQVTEGFAAAAARDAYARARDLCRASEGKTLFSILWGLWLFHKVRSELARAREMAEGLDALACRLNDPALALQAQQALAVTSLCRGEPTATVRHMEQATTLYDPVRHRSHSTQFGQDPGVACKAFGSVALWLMGYPDEAVRVSDEAIRLAWELSQPSSQALALHFAAMVHQFRRDGPRVLELAEDCRTIAAEHGFSFWLAGATLMGGWALAAGGHPAEGLTRLARGLLDWQATGSLTYRTYQLGLLAEVLGGVGQYEEAGRVLEEALDLARRTGEGLFEVELHRLSGELLLAGPAGERVEERAEEHFWRALAIARGQEARGLELRVATSLTRLAVRTGRPEGALELLAAVHGRFDEGLETPDVREARELLGAGVG